MKILKSTLGVTLIELMVAVAITGIIALFSFDSVRRVITASMTVQKKADFETLMEQVRYNLGSLEQCTCNFSGRSFATGANTLTSQPTALFQFTNLKITYSATTGCSASPGIYPCCNTPVAPQAIISNGAIPPGFTATIQNMGITNIQYLQGLNVARALFQVSATVPQQVDNTARVITRSIPVLFAIDPNAPGTILGCIGMSR